jgi:hypothetical protein
VYESCRLAALIYCHVLYDRFPSSDIINISPSLPLLHSLQAALVKTDISECWGDMAGVLYWCALVGGIVMHRLIGGQNLDIWEKGDCSKERSERCGR